MKIFLISLFKGYSGLQYIGKHRYYAKQRQANAAAHEKSSCSCSPLPYVLQTGSRRIAMKLAEFELKSEEIYHSQCATARYVADKCES